MTTDPAVVAVDDELLTLGQASRLPCFREIGRRGRAPSTGRMARWCVEGMRAASGKRVTLAHTRFGGRILVTRQAIAAFIEQLNDRGPVAAPVTQAQAARLAHTKAEAELDSVGI